MLTGHRNLISLGSYQANPVFMRYPASMLFDKPADTRVRRSSNHAKKMLFVELIPSRPLMRTTGRKRSIFTEVKGQEKIMKKLNEFWTIVIDDAELQWPTLRRRHGDAVQATVASCRTTQAQVDDMLVRARISEGQFAPNKRPASFPVRSTHSKG
jgi:hypothetical protein